LRKRFEYANAEALEGFLADLSEYEEKKQYHAKTNVFEDQHAVLVSTWTHVARRRSDAKVEDKDEKTLEVTARDIRLAYALEELFESTLAAGGREYVLLVRPGRDAKNGRGAERSYRSYLLPNSLGEGELDIVRAHCLLTRH